MLVEETKKMYSIRCNSCGKYYESHDGFALFNLQTTVEDYIESDPRGWMEFSGEHYCPTCSTEKEVYRLDKKRKVRTQTKKS